MLSADELKQLEGKITAGDLSQVNLFVDDTIRHYFEDKDEVFRRRKIIGRSEIQNDELILGYGLFSIILDQKPGWDLAAEELDFEKEPGYGFFAHLMLKLSERSSSEASKWRFLVEDSARAGHLLSKFTLMKWQRDVHGRLMLLVQVPLLLWLSIKWVLLTVCSPQDRRLATYVK